MGKNIFTNVGNEEVVVFNTTNQKCYIGEENDAMKVLKGLPVSYRSLESQYIECTTFASKQTFMVKVYDVSDIESLLYHHKERFYDKDSKESYCAAIAIRQMNISKALMHNALMYDAIYFDINETLRAFYNEPEKATSRQKANLQDAVSNKVRDIQSQSKLSPRSITVRLYNLLFKAFKVDIFDQLGGGVIDIAVDYVKDLDPKLVENYKLK